MSKASREWKKWNKSSNKRLRIYPSWCYTPRKEMTLKGYRKHRRYINRENSKTRKNNADFEAQWNGGEKYE